MGADPTLAEGGGSSREDREGGLDSDRFIN